MTPARYSARMTGVRGGRLRASGVVIAVGVLMAVAACGGDGSSSGTLEPLGGTPGASGPGPVATTAQAATLDTTLDPSQAGSGFVNVDVQLAASGVRESISLDRATVRADQLDPVSLDATCTALDGGDPAAGVAVTVVDLRRMGSEARLVSAAVRVEGDGTPGEHDVTIDVGGVDQVTTSYSGTVQLADGAMTGTFEAVDAAGNAVTGSFVCSAVAVTTTVPAVTGGGEEVPDSAEPGG